MSDSYQANISRGSPGCILFLLDVSRSMLEPFEHRMRRIDFLADAVNRTLTEVAAACRRQDGTPAACRRQDGTRHYFDIGVFAYSGLSGRSVLSGSLAGRDLVSVTDLAENPLDVENRVRKEPDGAGGLVEVPLVFPVWFKPEADGGTSMCGAFRRTANIVADWCRKHPASFPPIVLHITDGEATDGEPADVVNAAKRVTDQRTQDGYVLLLNLHIASGGTAVRFPTEERALPPHPYARALFQASSTLPPVLLERGFRQGFGVQPGSKGYIHNGGMEDVLAFLDIGTRAATGKTVVPLER